MYSEPIHIIWRRRRRRWVLDTVFNAILTSIAFPLDADTTAFRLRCTRAITTWSKVMNGGTRRSYSKSCAPMSRFGSELRIFPFGVPESFLRTRQLRTTDVEGARVAARVPLVAIHATIPCRPGERDPRTAVGHRTAAKR